MKKRISNPFLWISVLLFISGLIGGYFYSSSLIENSFPLKAESGLECNSLSGFKGVVVGDFLSCDMVIDAAPNSNMTRFEVYTVHYAEDLDERYMVGVVVGPRYISEVQVMIKDIRIPIRYPGNNEFWIYYDLDGQEGVKGKIQYWAVTEEAYSNKQRELWYTVYAIIIGLIGIFPATKALMDIWDREKK